MATSRFGNASILQQQADKLLFPEKKRPLGLIPDQKLFVPKSGMDVDFR